MIASSRLWTPPEFYWTGPPRQNLSLGPRTARNGPGTIQALTSSVIIPRIIFSIMFHKKIKWCQQQSWRLQRHTGRALVWVCFTKIKLYSLTLVTQNKSQISRSKKKKKRNKRLPPWWVFEVQISFPFRNVVSASTRRETLGGTTVAV